VQPVSFVEIILMTCVHENMLRQSNWMVKWCLLSKIQC